MRRKIPIAPRPRWRGIVQAMKNYAKSKSWSKF